MSSPHKIFGHNFDNDVFYFMGKAKKKITVIFDSASINCELVTFFKAGILPVG